MNEEKLYNQIEAYLAGELSDAEMQMMEKEMATDNNLKKEVAKHELSHQAMEVMIENNLRNSFQDWEAEGEAKVVGINRGAKMRTMYRRLAAAMSMILLVGFGLSWMVSGDYSNENLYNSNYEAPQPGVRGQTSGIIIDKALTAFDTQDYDQAEEFLNAIPENNDYFDKANYYLGHVFIAKGDTDLAIKYFQTAINGKDIPTKEKAEWNLVLTKVNTNQIDEQVQNILNKMVADKDYTNHDKAVKLNDDLNSLIRKVFH